MNELTNRFLQRDLYITGPTCIKRYAGLIVVCFVITCVGLGINWHTSSPVPVLPEQIRKSHLKWKIMLKTKALASKYLHGYT